MCRIANASCIVCIGIRIELFMLSKFDLKNKDLNLNKGFFMKEWPKFTRFQPKKNRHIFMINFNMCIAKKLKDH